MVRDLPAQAIASSLILLTSDFDTPPLPADGVVDTYEDVATITNIHLEFRNPLGWKDIFLPWNAFRDMYMDGNPGKHVSVDRANEMKDLFDVPKIILGGNDILDAHDVKRWYAKNAEIVDQDGNILKLLLAELLPPGKPANSAEYWLPYPRNPTVAPRDVVFKIGLQFSAKQIVYKPHLPTNKFHTTCSCEKRPCPSGCCPPDVATHCFNAADVAGHGCYDGRDIDASFQEQAFDIPRKSPVTSDVCYVIRYKDRTPPRIFEFGNEIHPPAPTFPLLGGPPDPTTGVCPPRTSTTGDFYALAGLAAKDNSGKRIYSCFGIGRMVGPPGPGPWSPPPEDWKFIGSIGVTLPGESLASHVFLPNDCLGEMKYTVFAWDENKVLNPGEPMIQEDVPTDCYGLRGPLAEDLLTDPGQARPFPYMVTKEPDQVRFEDLDIRQRIEEGEGTIWVDDNDRPNIIIRVQSMRDPNDVLFFPPVGVASVQTLNDAEYSQFIEKAPIRIEDMTPAYVRDYDIIALQLDGGARPLLSSVEATWASKFLPGPARSESFIRQHFRLENFARSDTDLQGNPIVADAATFGERNGWGYKAVLVQTIPLIEDVEYEVTIWAEDNVHFLNWPLSGKVIDPPYSGIERGEFIIDVPNQVPPLQIRRSWRKDQYKSEPIRVVFREPTVGEPTVPGPGNPSQHPSISATMFDYRGNERSLTVLFKVTDEKTRIRVLEQKHRKLE
ncbi:MAG: hypothetical protein OZSIB_3306 [Candidatus Ozemobacter sibiricus]|uniref:Uncharacterized protein n=1 Tax=Candidatus Ozemobacter sibiricus TaxID=2268124 RepID=A0A367ZF32_9BACT|nr:MAG: hypothetical protein OZSIB_3306 [Candidatus Ozemobacter sibiricus]